MQIEQAYVESSLFTSDFTTYLMSVIHSIDETIVRWDQLEKVADNVYKRDHNAKVAYDACVKLGLKLTGIGSVDILHANKKYMLSILW